MFFYNFPKNPGYIHLVTLKRKFNLECFSYFKRTSVRWFGVLPYKTFFCYLTSLWLYYRCWCCVWRSLRCMP